MEIMTTMCLLLVLIFARRGTTTGQSLNECVKNLVHGPYTGTVSVTNHGLTCQAWALDYPHIHIQTNDAYFPADGGVVGASNYCRNFGGSGRPWCYTVHPYIIFEYCDLRICNGTSSDDVIHLKDSSGTISSPDSNKDGLYDLNIDLLWIIEAPSSHYIRFQLHHSLIANSQNCYADGLKIFEASLSVDHVILCGEIIFEAEFHRGESITNVLYVHFYSDYEKASAGFELTFDHQHFNQVQARDCDEIIREPRGWISSPDMDSDGLYDFNMICLATVEVADDAIIVFKVLYIEIQYFPGCTFADYLEVSDEFSVLTLLCGFGGERLPVETRSNVMYVKFVSNNFITAAGFNLSYEAIKQSVDVCGGNINGSSGVIVSPDQNFDDLYENNVICIWRIVVTYNHVIRYGFVYFETEYSTECDKDSVSIYEPNVSKSKVTYCGRLHDQYEGETIANLLTVEFHSDDVNQFKGFKLYYIEREVFDDTCGGTLTNSSGYITAPDLDSDGYYDYNVFCFWLIQADRSASILYQLLYIEIESTSNGCDVDYLGIKEELTEWTCAICPSSNLTFVQALIKDLNYAYTSIYCGFHNTTDVERTKSNTLEVTFMSDGRLSYPGFCLLYAESKIIRSEETLNDDIGIITPPNVSPEDSTAKYISCEWTIFAKPDKCIQFEVVYVRTPESTYCVDYFLEIIFIPQNGRFSNYRFCGNTVRQEPIRTKSSWVFFHFLAQPVVDSFLVSYKQLPEFKEDLYIFLDKADSPGYITPFYQDDVGLYDYNLLILWTILADDDKVILMNFLYIDIEEEPLCLRDSLKISDGTYSHILCGIGTKLVLSSTVNVVSLLFVSDFCVNKAGFNLKYMPINDEDTECGDVLTGQSDVILSPDQNGDGHYDSLASCLWTIHLEDDYVIIFDIIEMDIQEETASCKADALEIKEGHRVIGRFCGSDAASPFTTESNILYLWFETDVIVTGKGFTAVYRQAQEAKSCSKDYQCLLSNMTTPLTSICDDYIDCPNSDDERFCDFRCPAGCVCFGLFIDCTGKDSCHYSWNPSLNITGQISVPVSTRRLDVSTNPRLFRLMNIGRQDLSFLMYLNVSYCEITHFNQDFFKSMINLKVLDIGHNYLKRLTANLFLSQTALKEFYFVGNFESITLESGAFSGLVSLLYFELSSLHISRISQNAFATVNSTKLKISDSHIDVIETFALGGLSVESIYLDSTEISDFSESMFHGVQGIKLLKTDKYKFCCVRPIAFPEEDCFPRKDEFSSCDDLIRNEVLRPLVWIIGIFTVLTNTSSILFRTFKQKEQLKRSYGIFVTNLAVSDSLMGIYLLIVAAADAYFRNTYIFNDSYWRYSGWCKIAGILSTVSNESSMMFVCLITLDRLLIIKFPLGQVRFIIRYTRFLSVIVWIIAGILALLPVTLHSVFKYKLYSQSGVCLALPITRARPLGHAYAVGLFLGFNSVGYILIALGQWSIFREINISSKSVAASRSKLNNDTKVARSLLLVAITDIVCWLPVTILGILALLNQVIEGEAYSWIAVIVLPVNAAANPAIYTLSAAWQTKQTRRKSGGKDKLENTDIEYSEGWIRIWKSRDYWQGLQQIGGFVSLYEALNTSCMTGRQKIIIARNIVRTICRLHSQHVIQKGLKSDDILVSKTNKNSVKVAMVLRPKYTLKSEDYQGSILALGSILSKLIQTNKP